MRARSSVLVVFGAFLVMSILSIPVSFSVQELSSGVAWAQEQPPANPPAAPPANPPAPASPPAQVDIQVDTDDDSTWVVDRFWLVVGGIGLLAILALLVAAGRSSSEGPTVIKT